MSEPFHSWMHFFFSHPYFSLRERGEKLNANVTELNGMAQ